MGKIKRHGIGLDKHQAFVVDPTGAHPNTVRILVPDSDNLTPGRVRALVWSHSHTWLLDQTVAVTKSTPHASPNAAEIAITAKCVAKKSMSHFYGDGDDDLIVTINYDDGAGGTESDECTFTDVEYDSTTYVSTKAKNQRP